MDGPASDIDTPVSEDAPRSSSRASTPIVPTAPGAGPHERAKHRGGGMATLPATEILPSTGLALPNVAPAPATSKRSTRPSRKRSRTEPAHVASQQRETQRDLEMLGVPMDVDEDELEELNNDYCETCHGHGRFLCCDGCPRSFHFMCVCPPLDVDEMPFPNGTLLPRKSLPTSSSTTPHDLRAQRALADDSWFCQVCFAQRLPPRVPKGCGPFGVLLQRLACENPRIFELPADIRTYYKGVGTAPDGTYVDTTAQRPLKLSRTGFLEERDPYILRDKRGEPVLCFRCGESALPPDAVLRRPHESREMAERRAIHACHEAGTKLTHGRRMLSCDFCTLHWHLDCVDPPLTGMPPATRRWRCPAHSEPGRPRMRIPRAPQLTRTITIVRSQPLPHIRRDALVDIVPDPQDRYFDLDTGAGHAREPPWDDVTLDTGEARVRYRLPEKSIRLAFWQAIRRRDDDDDVARSSTPAASTSTHPPYIPTLWEQLVDVATHAEPVRTLVSTPQGAVREEFAAAARASLTPNAQPFAPAQRTSYRPEEAEPLVPPATEPDDVPGPPTNVPITYLYPQEIAELRALKHWLTHQGGYAAVRAATSVPAVTWD